MSWVVLAGIVVASFVVGVAAAFAYMHPVIVDLGDTIEKLTRGLSRGARG